MNIGLSNFESFIGGKYNTLLTLTLYGVLIWDINVRLKDNEQALEKACRLDLGKSAYESYVSEFGWSENDIVFVCKNLEKWAKDEKAPDIPLMNAALSPKIRKDPLGVVLVIGWVVHIMVTGVSMFG